MAVATRVEDADPSWMRDFQRTTVGVESFSWRTASAARTVFFAGLQVEPEPEPRRGANGLGVARFPDERLGSKEDSVYCQDNKIHGRFMVRTLKGKKDCHRVTKLGPAIQLKGSGSGDQG